MSLRGKHTLAMAPQDVNGDAGDEIDLGVQTYITGTLAFSLVRNATVEWLAGLALGPVNGDVQFQVHGKGQADHIETRSDVCARAWCPNDKAFW